MSLTGTRWRTITDTTLRIRFWVAHASRVLANASSRRALSLEIVIGGGKQQFQKHCFGVTPKPARGTHALPDHGLSQRKLS
jgi:hypothetical protein